MDNCGFETPIYTPEAGCCPVDPCKIELGDTICFVRDLLPPGEAWRRPPDSSFEKSFRPGCSNIGDPLCQYTCDGMASFFDSIAAVFHDVLRNGMCAALAESDPCTANRNVETLAERYGVPFDCRPLPCLPDDVRHRLLKADLCAREMIGAGVVPNCCFFEKLAVMLNVTIKCISPSQVECRNDRCGYGLPPCLNCTGGTPLLTGSMNCDSICAIPVVPEDGCDPDFDKRTLPCEDDDCQFWVAPDREICTVPKTDCGISCPGPGAVAKVESDCPVPDATIMFKICVPHAAPEWEFSPGCAPIGAPLCMDDRATAMRCLITKYTPSHVRVCFLGC